MYHRKRMIRRINEAKRIPSFYYALSHLWGLSENNRHYWNDISEHVDDENGQPVHPVSMRPEKRDALLTMLKDHPDSYWWMMSCVHVPIHHWTLWAIFTLVALNALPSSIVNRD